jgi:predicted amidohydrolase
MHFASLCYVISVFLSRHRLPALHSAHSAPVKNADTAEAMVRAAAARGAQVILLQELFEAPYFCQLQRADFFHLATVADVEKNPLLKRFAALAAELQVRFTFQLWVISGGLGIHAEPRIFASRVTYEL